MYDSAVIGTGPAGISAVLNLKIHNKNFIWLGNNNLSDKISKAEKISNYPGFFEATGAELFAAFKGHVEKMGIEVTEKMVNQIYLTENGFALMAGNDFFETKTVILTTGVAAVGTLDGEAGFVGRGISYCATCDGGLYRGKTIAVICSNKRFEHEVKYLSELAEKIYYFPTFRDPSDIAPNVCKMEARAVKIEGGMRVTDVVLSSGEKISVDGVFCLRDAISLGTLLPTLEVDNGHIKVDRKMATNIPGCYAAGDCTGRPYQYTKAVGEGNVAAHSVIEYLSEKE
ncbi:MAG: NAD(P)/FAD-dependent oxidoreductase [Clostridia bacterium]|nr:NAD(P)/FAD-dependent oxidoreductase [Clostridia bacterium]